MCPFSLLLWSWEFFYIISGQVEQVGQVGQVDLSTRLVTWMRGVTGMGIMLSILKNIIGGVTDVMVNILYFGKCVCIPFLS